MNGVWGSPGRRGLALLAAALLAGAAAGGADCGCVGPAAAASVDSLGGAKFTGLWEAVGGCPEPAAAVPGGSAWRSANVFPGIGLLPSRYSLLEEGRGPTVRSQGKYGTCWALTAASALESMLLPEEHLVFSADHIVYQNSYTVDVNEGGDYLMAMAYLSGWQGPVLEEEDPYGDGFSPEGLTAAVHVQEMQLLEDADPEEIKEALYRYGAVQASLYMNRAAADGITSYYNEGTDSFYCAEEYAPSHEVLILGWDDSYSRFRFSQIPERDGAFLCQNSWGEGFGDGGLFYVSYEDVNLGAKGILYTRVEDADNYSRIYQTDDCGWVGTQGYGSDTCWFANRYTAQTEEALAAAGFYATGKGASYELYLALGDSGECSFAERELIKRGSMERAGYYTVDLEEAVPLEAGQEFALIVKLTVPGGENPVAVEYRAGEDTRKVTTEGKRGYISRDGADWECTQERYGTNVCLKAYTRQDGWPGSEE